MSPIGWSIIVVASALGAFYWGTNLGWKKGSRFADHYYQDTEALRLRRAQGFGEGMSAALDAVEESWGEQDSSPEGKHAAAELDKILATLRVPFEKNFYWHQQVHKTLVDKTLEKLLLDKNP